MNIKLNEILLFLNILFVLFYCLYLIKVKAFSMNAEPLTQQPLFKAAIIIPIVSFFLIGGIAWSGHAWKLDDEGLNNFINISKLPLGILSLTIPFGVIVNNIHRTIQTDKQIKEAERKNSLDRYYAHRKNTIELLQNLKLPSVLIVNEDIKLQFENSYSTYKNLYPNASINSNDFSPSKILIKRIEDIFSTLNKLLMTLTFESKTDYYMHLRKVEEILNYIHSVFGFNPIKTNNLFNLVFIGEDNLYYEFRTFIKNEHSLKMNIASYWLAYVSVCEILEVKIPPEFKDSVHRLVMYGVNTESKYPEWATSNLVNGSIPKFLCLGAL